VGTIVELGGGIVVVVDVVDSNCVVAAGGLVAGGVEVGVCSDELTCAALADDVGSGNSTIAVDDAVGAAVSDEHAASPSAAMIRSPGRIDIPRVFHVR
jgi:hypothetical protein